MSPALITRIAEEHAAVADSLPTAVVGGEKRRSALEALAARGLPTSRDENWKYTNLRPLEKVRFAPVASTPAPSATVTADQLPAALPSYARYTFVDGVYAPALSSPAERAGVTVRPLRADATVARLPRTTPANATATDVAAAHPDLRFALLNEAFATDAAWIRVAAGVNCPTCVELVFVASADAKEAASYPRVELEVAAGAQLGLIERHVSLGSDANFVNAVVNLDIGRGASVQHYRLQQAGTRATCIDTLSAVLAQEAVYRLSSIALGGLSARSTMHIQLAGERSDVSVLMASLGERAQVQDAFALVEHIAPYAKTEQTFRGISSGRARVGFNGKVVVRKDARGTDSRQSLRGLLAGPEAEIDVRPQLEIYTDDVRCNHGATAGKLDENMLFYLLSRGLERETAQRLLKWAFLEDVVSRIEVPELRRQIELSLAGHMQAAWVSGAASKELL